MPAAGHAGTGQPRSAVSAVGRASARAAAATTALGGSLAASDLTEDEVVALFAALSRLGAATLAVLDVLVDHLPSHDNAAKAARALGLARDSCRWMSNDQLLAAEALGVGRHCSRP